jgi:hypothetical protein
MPMFKGGLDPHMSNFVEDGTVNTKIWYRRESDLWAQFGKNPIQRRKVSSKGFGKGTCGRQFASVRQRDCLR